MHLPSVTTVLGHFKEKSLESWKTRVGEETARKISTQAADRGTRFHELVEKYLKNESNLYRDIFPDVKELFISSRPLLDRIDQICYIEAQLWSETLGVAGRVDAIGEFDGKLSIIDFKTSSKPKRDEWIESYFEQETCYALLYEERVGIAIDQIVTIIAVPGRPAQLFIKSKEPFVATLKEKLFFYNKEHTCLPLIFG